MRIDPTLPIKPETEISRPGKNAGTAGQASAAEVDKASLSAEHSRIQQLQTAAATLPDVRAEKVQALQCAIADGSFRVQPDRIADAIMTEMFR